MALYSVDKDGHYHEGTVANKQYKEGAFVAKKDVPAQVQKALEGTGPGVIVDELGDSFNPETDTDESKDENLGTDPKSNLTPAQKRKIAEEKEKQDQLDDHEDPDADEEDIVDPTAIPTEQDDAGMGWKRVKGKTVSIFSNVPHETVKSIAGHMVPLTHKEYEEKSDQDILRKLRSLKKI